MEIFFLDEVIEIYKSVDKTLCKSNLVTDADPHSDSFSNTQVDYLVYKEGVVRFLTSFIFMGGRLNNSSCYFSHHLEEYITWIKECFIYFNINGSVKNTFKGRTGKPAIWVYESNPIEELAQFKKIFFEDLRGGQRRRCLVIEKTPLTLFFWYLTHGVFCKTELDNRLLLGKSHDVAKFLKDIGIVISGSGLKDIKIKEPEYEKFFAYICEVPFLIPECFHHKFPVEFIQRNKDYVLTYKPD